MRRAPWERRGGSPLPDFAQDWVDEVAVAREIATLRARAGGLLRVGVDGAGDLALTLLARGVDEVVLTVRSSGERACAEARRAAARELPAASIRSFLGWGHFGRRVWFYHYLRPGLPEDARAWLDTHEDRVREGLLGAGAWERRLARLRAWAPTPLATLRWRAALEATCRLEVPGAAPDDATGPPSAQPIAPEVMLDEVRVPRDKPVLVVRGRGSRVIVYLHGRCGEPERLRAWAAAASTFGTVIALRGEVRCRDGVRARWTEDVATIDRRITAAIRAVGANHPEPLDANARVVFGYSQGALRAESLASRFPERYPLVVLAAGPRGPRADALAKVRRAVVVAGELDVREPLAKGADELLLRGVPARYVELPGARHGEFGPEAVPRLEAALAWLVDAGGDAPHTAHLAPL